MNKPEKVQELASRIYIEMCGAAGAQNWDWKPVATAALDAAEVFVDTFNERYGPARVVQTSATQQQKGVTNG
jgi:hypothetical protein